MVQTLDMPVKTKPAKEPRIGRQPPYHVILHNDQFHSYQYVVKMLMTLLHKSEQDAIRDTKEVDEKGLCIVDTTTLERAELKRDQIHAFGKDPLVEGSKGSMSATLEPAE